MDPSLLPPRGCGQMFEETPQMLAGARMVVAAESALQDDDLAPPVIAPERMADFRREWLRRPGLRCLIRAAQDLPPERRRRNRTLQGLWEMAHSPGSTRRCSWSRAAPPPRTRASLRSPR